MIRKRHLSVTKGNLACNFGKSLDFRWFRSSISYVKLIPKHILWAAMPFAFCALPTTALEAQPASAQNSQNLQDALRRIAQNSNNSSALADAGLAALALGDTRAAIGFLARADEIYPRSGRVKAGLAKALLEEQNPFGALRYFDQAVANGVPLRDIAADRGLAYDLIGRNADAQRDYKLALQYDSSDVLLRRYAISLGISGDIEQSDLKLNPLLQNSNRDAWRERAFILAMNGKTKDANAIAKQTMQKRMANAIKPFFERMPKLTAAQKAAAIHFGHFPASENIGVDVASVQYAANSAVRGGDGADAGLIPLGEPLGSDVRKPRVLTMPDTSPRRRPGTKTGKEKVELVLLDRTALPAPGRRSSRNSEKQVRVDPDSREGRRLLRQAARDGSAEAKAYLERQKKKNSKPSKQPVVETKTAQRSKAVVDGPTISPKANSDKRQTALDASVKPGFQTPVANSSKDSNKPVQIARVDTKKPEILSASVERKIAIGDRGPNKPAVTAKPAPVPVSQNKKPVQLVSFDLGKSVPQNSNVKQQPVNVAQAQPARKPLADIMKSISIPDSEKKTEVVPVNLETIIPAKNKPKEIAKSTEKSDSKIVSPKKEAHPKRYWVQVATGSNLKALKYDFRQMKKKNPKLFGDKGGWTSPWGKTRRMVVGPFDDLASAKKFDSSFRKNGGDSFAWVSKKGTEVNKLP